MRRIILILVAMVFCMNLVGCAPLLEESRREAMTHEHQMGSIIVHETNMYRWFP